MNTTTLPESTLAISSTVFLFTLIIYFSVSLPLNCYITFLLLSKGGGVDVSMVFGVNNAIAEILLSLVALLYVLCKVYFRPWFAILEEVAFGTSISARFLFQCCVCLERYLAVIHPVTFLRFKPLRYRVGCSTLAWLCALVVGAVSIYSFPVPPYNAAIVVYFIILTVELYCCVSVLKALLRPAPGDKQEGNASTSKKKAFQLISVHLMAIVIQNIPVMVSYGSQKTLSVEDFDIVQDVSLTINFFAGFLQPVCILHKAGKLGLIKCVRT